MLQVLHSELAGRSPPRWPLQATLDHPHRPSYPAIVVRREFSQFTRTNLSQGHISLFIQCIVPLCLPDLHGHLRDTACKIKLQKETIFTSFLLLLISSSVLPLFLNWAAREAAAAAFSLSLILLQLDAAKVSRNFWKQLGQC